MLAAAVVVLAACPVSAAQVVLEVVRLAQVRLKLLVEMPTLQEARRNRLALQRVKLAVAQAVWVVRPKTVVVVQSGAAAAAAEHAPVPTLPLARAATPFTAAALVAEVGAYLLEMPVKVTAQVEPLGSMAAALLVAPMERRAELAPQATPTRSLVAAVVAVVAVVLLLLLDLL